MTQQEFQTRVQMIVSYKEFESINEVYMNSDLDKDEFCKAWIRMNQSRVKKAKATAKAKEERMKNREKAWSIFNLISYVNWDFQNKLAINVLTDTQQNFLKSINIEMTVLQYGFNYFKTVSDVSREVKKYLEIV